MPFKELVIGFNTDDVGINHSPAIKLMLENWIIRITMQISYAKTIQNPIVKLVDGTQTSKEAWIAEATAELEKFKAELAQLKR
jgi:hypothetical protein